MLIRFIEWLLGRKYRQEFMIDYIYNGEMYCETIVASSMEEAKSKLAAIRLTGYISGQIV